MTEELLSRFSAVHHTRDGSVVFVLADGRAFTADLGHPMFEPTSVIDSSTLLPHESRLVLRTNRGDDIVLELPSPTDLAPLRGRPTIYLDQNHWSTLAQALHDPVRVQNEDERAAATKLIELARAGRVVLPMSAAHMAETSKQANQEQRYYRALTIAQLSAGWRFRDPLSLRQVELIQALTERYHRRNLDMPAAVTLEPDVVHEGRAMPDHSDASDLPPEMQWMVRSVSSVAAEIDAMLDTEPCPMDGVEGWTTSFQEFATFLKENPTGPERKRQRTHLRFIVDLHKELAEASYRAGITPQNMSDWLINHSGADIPRLPTLGLFRELLHEKLSDNMLQWTENDLTDMMYLTAATGYCDHVVGERSHTSHIANCARRLGRTISIHRSLRSLIDRL